MLMKEKEIDGIETVGDLRAALADVPDDMRLADCFGEPLLAALVEMGEPINTYVTIR